MSIPKHIEAKINRSGPIPEERPDLGPCWIYTGYLSQRGYGRTAIKGKSVRVHRVVFEALRGPIPEGLEPDHLCRVKACCNPTHLEPVPHRVNAQRGVTGKHFAQRTHCPKGHPYSEENTRIKKQKGGTINRVCRACEKIYRQRSTSALSQE